MVEQIKRKSLNWLGDSQGFGGCNRCGDRWSWKKEHSLEMVGEYGCFPLCEECWEDTTKEEKLAFYLHKVYEHPEHPQFDFQEADVNIRRQIEEYYNTLHPKAKEDEK